MVTLGQTIVAAAMAVTAINGTNLEHKEFSTSGRKYAPQPLLWVATPLAAGIVANRYGGGWLDDAGFSGWWLAGLAATLIALITEIIRRRWLSTGAMVAACFFLGGTWHDLHWNYVATNELGRYARENAEPVCLKAIATSNVQLIPVAEPNPLRAIPAKPLSKVSLTVTRLRNGKRWQIATGDVQLRVNGLLEKISAGDELLIFAQLSQVPAALNPGQYDYRFAERAAGRHCELFTQSPACVSIVRESFRLRIDGWLAALTRAAQRQIAQYVNPSQQAIAEALLLGTHGVLDNETLDAFTQTGTIHLLVVSGMHVGSIALVVWFLAGFLPVSPSLRIGLTIGVVLVYSSMVGWQPSVVRSTAFVIMTLVAITRVQEIDLGNGLAAAAIGVLALNPSELFRAGTQLSFLGVAAVVVATILIPNTSVSPLELMARSYESWHKTTWRWIKRRSFMITWASITAWAVLTPNLLYHFHIASPSAIVLTPLAWIPMAMALASGLVMCTLGFLLPPVAWLGGWLCGIGLGWGEWIVEHGSRWPMSYFYSPGPALWWVLVFYAGLAFFAIVPTKIGWMGRCSIVVLWIAVGLTAAAWNQRPTKTLHCSFVAVGHGTCVVIELPSGENILYDAGSLGSPEGATRAISNFLWSRGIKHIDAIVISHADVDHCNAVPGLIKRFGVGKIYISPLMFDPWANAGDLTAPNYLKEKINEANVPLEEVWMNDRIRVGDEQVTIEVLHPPRFGIAGRDNANSIVLTIEYAGRRIMLPGDLESPGLETVIAEPPIDVDILLAPHHGSSNSDPPGFAAWCKPEWVILSGRTTAAQTRLTTASYQDHGAEVLLTSRCGAVEFEITPENVDYQTFRSASP